MPVVIGYIKAVGQCGDNSGINVTLLISNRKGNKENLGLNKGFFPMFNILYELKFSLH